jgi:hypothetical protein
MNVSADQLEAERIAMMEQLESLKKEIAVAEGRKSTNDGQGGLMTLKQNMITFKGPALSVNGVDTAGMREELLHGDDVSNNTLVFINYAVRGVQQSDEALVEFEKYRKKWLHDTSQQVTTNKQRTEFAIQMDNGGARTVASRAFADHCKAPVMELKRPVNLMAFNKSITSVEHYAVFVVAVKSINVDSIEVLKEQTRKFRVVALINN